MQRTAALTPRPAVNVATSRCGAWLRSAWAEFSLDDDERYLREARDLADLEWRQRCLERGRAERFAALDPDA